MTDTSGKTATGVPDRTEEYVQYRRIDKNSHRILRFSMDSIRSEPVLRIGMAVQTPDDSKEVAMGLSETEVLRLLKWLDANYPQVTQ